jgi:hypothetical protein
VVGYGHLGVNRGVQGYCEVAWVRLNSVVDPSRSSISFGEETVVYDILRASTLREKRKVSK